ncbi:hypothetical protein ACH4NT_36630 [Streptomyces lydicus]|uniref:hypothetical protein n=1 Tax=Streptomyces lydicus TaxID=47763 RepID=UPI00378917D4
MSARLLHAVRFLAAGAVRALSIVTPLATGAMAALYVHGDLNPVLPYLLHGPTGCSLGMALVASAFFGIGVENLGREWFQETQDRLMGRWWPRCPTCAQPVNAARTDAWTPVRALPRGRGDDQ